MSSGGYRPGAGRKPGSKDKKPRQQSPEQEEAAKIRQMLTFNMKAKARFYQEFLLRVKKGESLSISEKKMMDKLAVELSADLTDDEKVAAIMEDLSPLEYMLRVMNDPKTDQEMRLRAASLAAPYVHSRKGEGLGKKEEKGERAAKAGQGRFAPSAAPLKIVKQEEAVKGNISLATSIRRRKRDRHI